MSEHVKESIRVLLSEAIDYAGLFPPAGLPMAESVINYATYRNSNYKWMLGRFVCPVGRLDEFSESALDFFPRESDDPWRVSALASGDLGETADAITAFNEKFEGKAVIDMLELKATSEAEIESAAKALPEGLTNYFELPLDESLPETISALAVNRQRAKIRTGGVTSDLFPSTRDVIRFIRTCVAANTPFKATAGLHHPIRCFKPLTYEPDSPSGTMHGFLNVFLATGFARESFRPEVLEQVMEEEFEEVFKFTDNEAVWQKEYELTVYQIEALRGKGINSFGSCSFDEPIADLQELGILEG
ncbi:MAG: hypothetical protein DWQ47_14410 [Acidobacteria bacterium]|nr:MAG: hypothetical protein DWQ32_01810 [Acidobacteriota bacterium]REK02739.1 MAG: hypothetical protein DWQ38_10325 [Acidobacteriota bacterium]REK13456.1 MAG: hypothetical protein DWQ43_07500 [Acidobacteriota bacterium]REK41450.1 MAG: hypothetical protein DWQ47_14410 [Acidobacteriota bacterium]